MMESKKPHIVALPIAGQGHVTPMMHLCGYLAKSGFKITFVLQDSMRILFDMIERKGTWPPGDLDITLVRLEIDDPLPATALGPGRANLCEIYDHQRKFTDKFEGLVRELGDVCCLLVDFGLAWNMDIAVKLGVPGALLFTGSAMWSWIEMEMHKLVSNNLVPMQQEHELSDEDDHLILEHPPVLRRSDIPWHFWNDRLWQERIIDLYRGSVQNARWVLGNSSQVLEGDILRLIKESIGPANYIPVGPLFMLNDDPTAVGFQSFDKDCLKWLGKQPLSSVLYISFGSLAMLPVEQVEEFVTGLEASEQRFLWVMRTQVHGDLNAEYCSGWYERHRKQGMMVSWAPQTEVLSHQAVGAFLSHCGWNSTIEGVSCGQPMLCWPCLFEQNTNARIITRDWKIGLSFKKGDKKIVERQEVERVIRKVMEGDDGKGMRQRAQELSGKLKSEISPPGGSSYTNLQSFIKDLLTR